jgi:hypothetical protein
MLAGRTRSTELRAWASKELRGYKHGDDVPRYRNVPGQICIDGQSGSILYKQQEITPYHLPEFARDLFTGPVELRHGIAEIERVSTSDRDSVQISPPEAADVIVHMNAANPDEFQAIYNLYWRVSCTAFHGVVEQVRTTLAEMISDMIAATPDDQEDPAKDVADQAVRVNVHGENNTITVHSTQTAAGNDATVNPAPASHERDSWWKRLRKRGWMVAISTVVAAVVGIFTWLDWMPWK